MSKVDARPARRTLVKGAAWALPAIAIAQPAMAQACSPGSCPPPPSFDFGRAVKNPGNSCTSVCVPKHSYAVPVTVSNPSDEDFYLKFTSYKIDGQEDGVFSVMAEVRNKVCTPVVTSCSVGDCETATNNSVCVPAGTASLSVWVTSGEHQSSPNAGQAISWQWIRKADCEVLAQNTATAAESPPYAFC